MNDKLGSRRVYLPQGRDPTEALVDAIAGSDADLFAQGDQIVWLKDTGELVEAGRGALLELIAKYVVTKHLVQHGGRWRVEFRPFEPDEMALRAVLMGEGGLAQRLPQAASETAKLSPQRQQEVLARLKIGERPDAIAAAYNVPVDTIRQLVPGR